MLVSPVVDTQMPCKPRDDKNKRNYFLYDAQSSVKMHLVNVIKDENNLRNQR